MAARSHASATYRFGFNGQEKDDEIAGTGNINTALFWEYDTRLGRRWNLDPKPSEIFSNYSCFNNNPLRITDFNGDEPSDNDPKKITVQASDNPSEIAKRNNISLNQLAIYNPEVFKNYEKYEDKSTYWKNIDKNWIIHPGQSLNVSGNATPLSGSSSSANNSGTPSSQPFNYISPLGKILFGLDRINTTFDNLGPKYTLRFYKMRGTKFSPKIYFNGWNGGSAGKIKTFNLSKVGSVGLIGITTAIDLWGLRNYFVLGPDNPNSVHPVKFTVNFGTNVIGYWNPWFSGLYFGVDAFYPGGWLGDKDHQGAIKDTDRLIKANQEINGKSWNMYKDMGGGF